MQKAHAPEADEEFTSIRDLPLAVTVEIARLQMSLDQLMHLKPGNHLDLPIDLSQTVFLSVAGKKIATGELIHVGEKLGVRILET